MQLEVSWVDCEPFLVDRQQPVELIKRAKPPERNISHSYQVFEGAGWYVAGSPVFFDDRKVRWSITTGSDNVRVPLFSYETRAKSMEAVFTTGIQIGVLGFHDVPKDKRVDKLHLAIGNVFESDNGYQCWIGLAFRMAN